MHLFRDAVPFFFFFVPLYNWFVSRSGSSLWPDSDFLSSVDHDRPSPSCCGFPHTLVFPSAASLHVGHLISPLFLIFHLISLPFPINTRHPAPAPPPASSLFPPLSFHLLPPSLSFPPLIPLHLPPASPRLASPHLPPPPTVR